jgi:small subunit ribosomal protein S1
MSERRDQSESFGALFEQGAGGRRERRGFTIGDKIEVTIVVVAQNAVFADLGGKQEGFFERVDLSDADGKLLVAAGNKVSATVDSIDRNTGQVRLRPLFVRNDEGEALTTSIGIGAKGQAPVLVEGARVKGSVTGVERYGVFVQIAGTQGRSGRGLVPISETATPRGSDLKKHFTVGQEVEAKILNIEPDGKIRLSVAALARDVERSEFEKFKDTDVAASPGEKPKVEADGKKAPQGGGKKPEPRGFGTLGDLLGKKKK